VFSIIPAKAGNMNPPQKNSIHTKMPNEYIPETKGIGIDTMTPIQPTPSTIVYDFLLL